MRGGNRRFYRGIINHIYQIAIDGDVIFYSISDHLVYFTIFCIYARKHGIRVLKLCQMPDHIHGSVIAYRKNSLSAFERDTTAVFAREHNGICHRKGPFFKSPFGSVRRDARDPYPSTSSTGQWSEPKTSLWISVERMRERRASETTK